MRNSEQVISQRSADRESGDRIHGKALDAIVEGLRSPDIRVIVVAGPAGAGKTWLAQEALAFSAADLPLVGHGKFSESDGQAALGSVMDALSMLLRTALAQFFDEQTGIASLAEALGVDLDVLISAGLKVPGLSERSSLQALASRRCGITRISAAVLRLLRWTEKFKVRRVLLIDDWQRGTADVVDLVKGIAAMTVGQPLTLLLTQREPATADMAITGCAALVVTLEALNDDEVEALLQRHLGDPGAAAPVSRFLIASAVPRLPFDIVQAADALRHSGALHQAGGTWLIDSAKVGGLAFDAETRIGALSPASHRLASALALWGDSAPADALEQALGGSFDTSPLADAIAELQRQGIVIRSDSRLSFCHDRLRRAAIDHADPATLTGLAAAMAERLPAHGNVEASALHLRLTGGLADAAAATWRDRFARGATEARGRGDVDAAGRFAEAALFLRGRTPPEDRDADRLILREAVLAAADRDDPDTEARAEALIAAGRSPIEQYEDYETGIVALRLAEQNEASWRLACRGLRVIGITPPSRRPLLSFIGAAALWWVQQRTDRLASPHGDMTMDAFTGVAAFAATIAYHRNPASAAIIGFRGSRAAGRTSRRSPYWQSVDAFLFAALGAYGRAAGAGERAIGNFGAQRVLRAATLYQALFFGVHWRKPLRSQRDRFRQVTRIALIEGDLITACYGLRIFIMSGWRTTISLDALRDQAVAARDELFNLGEASFVAEMTAMVALLDGLTGRTAWDPAVWRDDIPTRNHVIDLELSNLAGDWPETLRRAERLKPLRRDYNIQADSVVLRFHETIARLRCGLPARWRDLRFLRRAASLNPTDHRAKLLLIDAERQRRRSGRSAQTLIAYAVALDAAAQADSRLDAALAAGCAADFAASIGDPALAQSYRERAEAILAAWGVRAAIGPALPADPEEVAEARARADAAERSDQAKSRLLAHVGHELRTPLQALRALIDLNADSGVPADMDSIGAVLSSLTAVVDDLDIADGFADRGADIATDVDLADLLRSEMAVWQDRVAITLIADPACPRVDIAADRLRQIVRNLLSNAVKYGGSTPVSITLESAETPDDAVRVAIAVQDGGPGLDVADIDGLFEPFVRGAFKGDGRGTGLGLALSRRIAQRLGGSLEGGNAPGGGARFDLRFTATRAAATAAPGAGAAATVLLVEDQPLIRSLLAMLLTRAGHDVVEAATAAQAIAASRSRHFDVAVMDVGLPDASGFSVLAAIRAGAGAEARLPVIVLTASTASASEATAMADPAVHVLRKPVTAATLNAAIGALLAASPAVPPAAIDDNPAIAALYAEAEIAVRRQARDCLATIPDATRLHQLAGLAAQFGWTAVTDAVEDLAEAIRTGRPLEQPRTAIAAAIAGMA